MARYLIHTIFTADLLSWERMTSIQISFIQYRDTHELKEINRALQTNFKKIFRMTYTLPWHKPRDSCCWRRLAVGALNLFYKVLILLTLSWDRGLSYWVLSDQKSRLNNFRWYDTTEIVEPTFLIWQNPTTQNHHSLWPTGLPMYVRWWVPSHCDARTSYEILSVNIWTSYRSSNN